MRVMTYNVKAGMYHPQGLEAVARVIEAQEPDIVALQEVDVGLPRTGGVDQAAWLAERLGLQVRFGAAMWAGQSDVAYWFGEASRGVGQYGNALMIRPGAAIGTADSLALPLPVYPPDADARWPEPRGALAVHIELSAEPMWVISTHFGLEPGQRRQQAEFLRAQVGRLDAPVLLMGDFNGIPGSPELEPFADMDDVYAVLEGDPPVTFPSGARGTLSEKGWCGCIDHIFLRGLRARRAEVIYDETRASDHNPVVVELGA